MTDKIPPLMFRWDGEAMRPRQPRMADRHYTIGEEYALEPYKHRSKRSHDHWFVMIEEAFANLPEHMEDRWLSSEHFRKWILVRAGWCDTEEVLCETKAEATRVAALAHKLDTYAVVIVRGSVVTICRAKSQRFAVQERREFQAVKDRGLQIMAELLGVEAADMRRHAEAA